MAKNYVVRIIRSVIKNIKNVGFGEVKYPNYLSVVRSANLSEQDVIGIYGQNGSGKTALVEVMDMLKSVLNGQSISYENYSGIIATDMESSVETEFLIFAGDKKYRANYTFFVRKNDDNKSIEIFKEKFEYRRWDLSWQKHRDMTFENTFYSQLDLLETQDLKVSSTHEKNLKEIRFLFSMQNVAAACAKACTSVFFDDSVYNGVFKFEDNGEQGVFKDVIVALKKFSAVDFNVIKIDQLGIINLNTLLLLNVHREISSHVMQGYLGVNFLKSPKLPQKFYSDIEFYISAINIVLSSLIPDMMIEMDPCERGIDKNGEEYVCVQFYSVRNGKKFSLRHESEGIKRIISILVNLIAVYNQPGICLVVDELDSGIFEYLLGELLDVLHRDIKGQLIFTSHNLRILEKLDTKNIICSTTNPNNRFIRLTGVAKNNNKRDFYIRSLIVGGQKENLYDSDDLSAMGYAFRKAGKEIFNRGEQ